MRLAALELLACPSCHGPLRLEAGSNPEGSGELLCESQGVRYRIEQGIPLLVDPTRVVVVDGLARSYAAAWHRDGWGSPDWSYLQRLPFEDTSGRHRSEWKVKARSLGALQQLFARVRPKRVVDMGCGVGWLSYRLAQRGHEVYAIDVVLDNVLGLGAAGAYPRSGVYFERIQGELDRPPLRGQSFDAVVFNASLHYAEDLRRTLAEAKRVLKPGGVLVAMNSPVYADPESARRALEDFRGHLAGLGASDRVVSTYHHFTRESLVRALSSEIGAVEEEPFDAGLGFRWVRRLKGAALGMELASFPLLYVRLPS